jgi:hypothetical protein
MRRMAATLEVPPAPVPTLTLVERENPGDWTDDEIAQAVELATAAARALWNLGDWLLAKCPMGDTRRPSGVRERLAQLAGPTGISTSRLLALRDIAYCWPPETRLPDVSIDVHGAHRVGGPAIALERRQELLALPRGPRGKLTIATVTEWRREAHPPRPRDAHGQDPRRVPRPLVPTIRVHGWVLFGLCVDYERRRREHDVELRDDIEALIERIACHSSAESWLLVKRALDGVLVAVDALDG